MLISRTWQQKAIEFLLSWHAVLDRNAHGISESAGGYSTSDSTQSENCLFKGFGLYQDDRGPLGVQWWTRTITAQMWLSWVGDRILLFV